MTHLVHSINVTIAQYPVQKQQITKIGNDAGLVE
jgi:hypothetical protein